MSIHLKKGKWILIFCMLASAIFLSLLIMRPNSIEERVETLTLDYRFHIRNLIIKPAEPRDVIIIAIDERSLKEFGRWPWSRTVMAKLITDISELNPKIIAIDIFFTEPENESADKALGEAIERSGGRIVLAAAFEELADTGGASIVKVPDQIIDSAFLKVETINRTQPVIAAKVLPTVSVIAKNRIFGHVNSHPDYDGKLRWEILYLRYGDEFFPSLALQAARLSAGINLDEMVITGNTGVRLGKNSFIPTDQRGRTLINYLGKHGTVHYISASDILNKRVQKTEVENKIVLLGTSAIATYDLKNTPFSANMPGVEKNATVVENILRGEFLTKSVGYIEIIVIIVTGLLTGFFMPGLSALRGALLSFVLFAGYILLSILLFSYFRLWVNFIYPAANMMLIAVVVTVTKYFFEEKRAREIRAMFSSYVSPKIVAELINNPEKAKLGGERKLVTILFSDIIGFTNLSERKSPEAVVDLLNEYFKEMTDIIFRWDGTLDKFVGDEIMAFWGAPTDQPNHSELALRCALHMMDSLAKMQNRWRKEGKEILDCGIGINTGEVIIGNIGAAGKKMDYTVIGDHVNLAARVEKLTRNYTAKIIITEFTLDHFHKSKEGASLGHYQLVERDRVKVKGKEQEVRIIELKGLERTASHPE